MPYSHLHRSHHIFKRYGDLHVVLTYFNAMRYQSRLTLTHEFIERAKQQGAQVHVAEVAFGERPYEIKKLGQDNHFSYRTSHELWIKENVINATVARLPRDWKYVAWVDADIAFLNPHWAQETIQQLQHFPIVQMWQTAEDLDPTNNALGSFEGFVACKLKEGQHPAWDKKNGKAGYYYYPSLKRGTTTYWHPGYAWAARRDAWDQMGGLLDINVVGGGDHQMAHGLYGKASVAIPFVCTPGYRNAVMSWQSHAVGLKQNVGFVPGKIVHYWHGKKGQRGYFNRWQILANNQFDPNTDLRRDWQGLYQLAGNKPRLRDDLRAYFRTRQEDSIDV